jgi:hypothetical protein
MNAMRKVIRLFVAPWYLLGWLSHVYLSLTNPQIYAVFGDTALIPGYTGLWKSMVMPSITFFAFLLAGFEILVGYLLLSEGKWAKTGVVLSILFNLFLIQMGLGIPAKSGLQDFLSNRLPNLIFLAIQLPLLWGLDEWLIPKPLRLSRK